MRTTDFDPLAYIENAFLDKDSPGALEGPTEELSVDLPSIRDYLNTPIDPDVPSEEAEPEEKGKQRGRFRKTEMSAPRPRRANAPEPTKATLDPELQEVWSSLPRNVEFLCRFYDDSVTANYYRSEFKESRQDLIRRLLDPELSLEETSRLLGVCPATVRRYTNRGWLSHHRTNGGQRRFRLSHVVMFVEKHGRFPE